MNFVEAQKSFESLLEKNPMYVPGLIEISETYLHLMNESLDKFLDEKAAKFFSKALDSISQ